MTAEELLKQKIHDSGFSVAEVARRTGADADLLRRSLHGKRNFKSQELVNICTLLDITVNDLDATDGWKVEGEVAGRQVVNG